MFSVRSGLERGFLFPELAMPLHDQQRDQRLAVFLQPRQTQTDGSSLQRKSDS